MAIEEPRLLLPPWYRIALGELSVHEAPGEENDPRVQKYFASTALGPTTPDEVPWCAAFVGWCLDASGVPGTGLANARSYLRWGDAVADWAGMPIGAIVVFARPPIATQGHVGFYAGAQTAQSISVLGGNQGNAVRIAPYAKARLLGGRWPRLDRRNPR